MMKNLGKYFAAICCMVFAAGCIDVEYIGQDFPPLPETSPVLIFSADNEVPPGEFQVIGKLKMAVPSGIDMVEVREKIADEARAHGASAARIAEIKQKLVGVYYDAPLRESPSPMLAGRSTVGVRAAQPDGSPTKINSFGEVAEPNRPRQKRYMHVVKVQLLMPVKDHARAVELRRAAAEEK